MRCRGSGCDTSDEIVMSDMSDKNVVSDVSVVINEGDMKVAAIILSGGSGKRFGADVPKQYIEVQGRSILSYTIEAFEKSDVDRIVIVAAEEYREQCRQIALRAAKVKAVIAGGKERYDSVLQGLRHVTGAAGNRTVAVSEAEAEADEVPDIVLIHDGARPLIRPEMINEIIRCTKECGAAIAAAPCTDTIKIADEQGNIAGTTDRSRTWAAQTPQAFYTQEILQAYEKIIGGSTRDQEKDQDKDLKFITDDAMVYQMVFPDHPVRLINAGAENFKVTTPSDLARLEGFIKSLKP